MEVQSDKKLTGVEKGIIEYIQANSERIINMGIRELAHETFSSTTTILRLCKKLGYDGYRDFKFEIIQEVEARKYLNRNVDFSVPFDQTATQDDVIQSMYSLFHEGIQQIYAKVDKEAMIRAANILQSSEKILIYAIGDSLLTAQSFANKLKKIGIFPILATQCYEEVTASYHASSKDCALFVSYSGFYPTYVSSLQILNQAHARIIAVTANPSALIAECSQCSILIPHQKDEDEISTFYSQLAFNYILSTLYALIYSHNHQKNQNFKKKIDDARKQQRGEFLLLMDEKE